MARLSCPERMPPAPFVRSTGTVSIRSCAIKENGATLNLVGREKQKGLDLFVLDLIDKDKQSTRYYISAKTFQILWLEYQESPSDGAPALKYTRKFLDYRLVQSTRVPYRTVLMEEGRQTQETRI